MEKFYLISGETLGDISNLIKYKSGLDTSKTIPFADIGRALLNLESGIYKELFEKKVTQKNVTLDWTGVPPYSFSYVEGIDSLTFTSSYLTIDEGAFKGIQLDSLSFNLSQDQEFVLSHTFENAIINNFNYTAKRGFSGFGEAAFKNSVIKVPDRGLFPRQVEAEAFKNATMINSEQAAFYLTIKDEVNYGDSSFENSKIGHMVFEIGYPTSLKFGKDAFKNTHVDHLLFVFPAGMDMFISRLADCDLPTPESSPFNIIADVIQDNAWIYEYFPSETKIIKKYTLSNFPFQDSAEEYPTSMIDMLGNQLEEVQEKGLYNSVFENPWFEKIQKIGSQALANARTNAFSTSNIMLIGSQNNPVYSIASDAFLNIQIPDITALQIYYDNRIISKEDIPKDYDYEFLDGKWVPSGSTTLWGIGPEYIDILSLEWIPAFQEEE